MTERHADRWPQLAVLLCTHNGQAFLAAQLDSLFAQSWPGGHLFVHDWGSSDGTRALLERYRLAAPAGWVMEVVLHDVAPGAARSFMAALQDCMASSASFDYLFFCDQDDVWHPDKLQVFAEAIRARPILDLLYCDVQLIDADGRVLCETYLQKGGAFGRPMDVLHASTLFVNTVSGMSMAMSRRFLQHGQAAWRLQDWFMHDWAMTIFACLTQAEVAFIPHSLVGYRQHAGNLVGGVGGRPGRRSFAAVWRQARADVLKVERQFLACAGLLDLTRVPGLKPGMGRFEVAAVILRGRSFRLLKTLKVAIGYALFWPGRR